VVYKFYLTDCDLSEICCATVCELNTTLILPYFESSLTAVVA